MGFSPLVEEEVVGGDGSRGGFGEWVAAADPRRGKALGGGD